ncbi:MAG: GMC family oxidoreductase N-terminal domain-containing protein [Paracoccaceae bacterium]|nr:MAG: GMC family oxidoreductase N-terminal domain-containing protein [Paracoccaceae bacterium]
MTPTQDRTFRAVIDRIVPQDRDAGALALGADDHARGILDGDPAAAAGLCPGLDALDRDARLSHGAAFADLDAGARDALLEGIAREGWFLRLVEIVCLGVYADPDNGGNRGAASWDWLGYRHGMPEGPSGPARGTPPRPMPGPLEMTEFDVIVVGAGAGGGVAACVLAEAGKSVLLIERGLARSHADSGHRDHLRNHRLSVYGTNTGPGPVGSPRVLVDPEGVAHVMAPHAFGYHNNAACVGSGTLVYGGLAWRFHPDDFRMASRYGVPEGSSLTDWPIGIEDLAAGYARAEWEIGVAGEPSGSDGQAPGARGYPLPPVPRHAAGDLLRAGADRLGIATFAPPLLVNTRPRDGRGACIQCGSCVGFPCPTDARNGTQNTVIPRALATGRCTLVTDCTAEAVETDSAGRVTGVRLRRPGPDGDMVRQVVRARAVVLSAGAIESARLLLASASGREPAGLGNGADLVGRNLQGHLYPTVFGLFDRPVHDSRGPGVSIATAAYVHGNRGIVGGAMLADDFIMPPAIFHATALPPEQRRWGQEAKDFMRHAYRRVLQVKGPVHEIPDPSCRVTLDPGLRDAGGMPVARLSGVVHAETMRTAAFVIDRAEDWVRAAGAVRTWRAMPPRRLSGYQHQAGTCRMGRDPATSVTDSFGRVWGHDNLFVCDAALHPTNGAFNPVLTVMALAFRNADHIAASIR